MTLNDLLKQMPEWLKNHGQDLDIALSSRVRLARNLSTYPFVSQMTYEQSAQLLEHIKDNLKNVPTLDDCSYYDLDELNPMDLYFLLERHLISKELVAGKGKRAVIINPDETLAIMLNEEDHLRLQMIRSSTNVVELWKEMDNLDDVLSEVLPFAFDRRFGYLTACPTNVGTGLRISVMLHLPGLQMSGQIDKVCQAAARVHLQVRGFYGEGTAALGDFFQISNQTTLGKKELEIAQTIETIVPQIIKNERHVRQAMLRDNKPQLDQHVSSALNKLKDSKSLTSEDAMAALSAVRLGVNMKMIEYLNIEQINKLFILSQPSHMQKMQKNLLTPEERDTVRAKLFRDFLAKV